MTLSNTLYRCTAGETFDSVALEVYGNENYASEILNANPDLCLVTMFSGGELLDLPIVEIVDAETEDEETIMPVVPPWKE